MNSWYPVLAMAAGMPAGLTLAAYAGWIVRCRRCDPGERLMTGAAAAGLVNGIGWFLAAAFSRTSPEAVELGLLVSAAVVLTLIDVRIRVIPNELVAALLCLSAGLGWMENGLMAFPAKLVGFLVALTLFLVAMLLAGPGKIGGGDVKLAVAMGFAAGFPDVLVAVLLAAVLASLTGAAGIILKRMGRKTPMPFAGFIMGGLALTVLLDRLGALGFIH